MFWPLIEIFVAHVPRNWPCSNFYTQFPRLNANNKDVIKKLQLPNKIQIRTTLNF